MQCKLNFASAGFVSPLVSCLVRSLVEKPPLDSISSSGVIRSKCLAVT